MTIAVARRAGLDLNTQSKLAAFSMARLALMTVVLFSTILLRQEVLGETVILQIYGVLCVSFLFSLINVSLWEQTLRVRLYIPSQLFYDLLLTSYLVYLTGVNDSIFLFLYLLNIVFASVVYQLHGALLVAGISGVVYAFIYYANIDSESANAFYNLAYSELLFLLTALLCGQLMDELKRQKLLLEAQRENIARLELLNDRLLNSVPLGIVTVDENEYVKSINQTALTLLRLDRTPEMRIKYHELLPELRGILEAWWQMSDTQRLRFKFRHGHSDKPNFSLNLVKLASVAGQSRDEMRYIFVFGDISKTLELERKLDLETRMAATGELAAGIAHEIRNPLASISGSIELLSKNLKISEEEDRKLLGIALREIKRLNNLISDFLEFAKPRDETADDFALRSAVEEVSEAILSRSKVQFRLEISPEILIHANRERLKQVLFNLFLNSIEASGSDAATITVKSERRTDGTVQIDLLDNGPGIPAELASKIFDPFFTTKTNGTGLGLATVMRILKAAKGEILVVASSKGAHFQLRVPASSKMEIAGTAS